VVEGNNNKTILKAANDLVLMVALIYASPYGGAFFCFINSMRFGKLFFDQSFIMKKKLPAILFAAFIFNGAFGQISNPTTVSNRNLVQNATVQNEYLKAISNPALVASHRWWKRINPNNIENDPLADDLSIGAKTNWDTSIVTFSKKNKIAFAGWNIPGGMGLEEDSLIHLKALTKLEHIVIPGLSGDVTVKHISGFSNLKTLRFARNGLINDKLTDVSIAQIAQLTRLEFLELPPCSKIKAGGYNGLKNLVGLRELRLIQWDVPNTELSFLASLKSLSKVNFYRSRITDTAFAYLSGHPYISELQMEFCPITNKSLAVMANFRNLSKINIGHSQIDLDTGFDDFRRVLLANQSLRVVNMYNVNISAENLQRLRQQFPNVSFFN
jgi:hypothetical protein